MIGLRQLEVEAGGFRVGPLDLEVADGAYAVLLGPSGAGKSLVLEALAGVRVAAAGRMVVDGDDVSRLPPERRRVGLVFQDGLLFPHLDVAGNVAYGLRAEGGSGRRGREDGVRELAASVGVEQLLKRRPDTLSGGERQRVALARALAARPRALLLDEPLSAVDVEAREDLQDMLRAVSRDRGLTVLHVTHDRAEAFALADVCAVLVDGRLRQVGRPQDVLRRPADDAVARFLGARNVLRAARDPGDASLARAGGRPLAARRRCLFRTRPWTSWSGRRTWSAGRPAELRRRPSTWSRRPWSGSYCKGGTCSSARRHRRRWTRCSPRAARTSSACGSAPASTSRSSPSACTSSPPADRSRQSPCGPQCPDGRAPPFAERGPGNVRRDGPQRAAI